MSLGESGLGLEDLAPELVVVAFLELLLGRGLDVGLLVDRVVLAALDRVKKNFGGLLDALEELVVFLAALSGLLVRMVLEDLLAVGLLDLVLSSLPAILGDTENLVVILRLVYKVITGSMVQPHWGVSSYLPVLGLSLEHHGVLGLANVAHITILNLARAFLGLNAIILGEGTLMTGSTSVSEEVRSHRLNAALYCLRELSDGLEILLSGPVAGQRGQRQHNGSH